MRAVAIRIRGQVQGVGFRPHVWRLARRHGLAGEVLNDAEGVLAHAQGDAAALEAFLDALEAEAPPLARIAAIERSETAPRPGLTGFAIAASGASGARTRIAPDAAICADCAAEIRAPGRRRGYAFTNCAHCGPRLTIIEALPYDRAGTVMRGFPMCPACRAEYEDPADRRFHAQPVACPKCGPRLWIEPEAADPVAEAARRLRAGEVVAIRALGGFHLACDALNEAAVARLRARKRRPAKPFAVMAPDLATLRRFADPTPAEAAALASPAAPVVLIEARAGLAPPLAPSVAPGQWALGWMLPATPLHLMLAEAFGGPLVMTSGNLAGEPQPIGLDEAREKLAGFADAFLMHDRGIARRVDDSVQRMDGAVARVIRRARGLAPAPIALHRGFAGLKPVSAMGGDMKAAICLLRGGEAILSHHLGDLESPLAVSAHAEAEADFHRLCDHRPEAIAADLHPGFRATRLAEARATALGVPLIRVQHHHAHVAACMAENGWGPEDGQVIGIALDGLGLGTDGTIWGGEILLADYRASIRLAHLKPVPLPGGAAAQREPWRMLLSHLDAAGLPADPLLPGRTLAPLRAMIAKGVNSPPTSSAGRLFDAVAAALALAPDRMSHEGEAAMALEAAARAAGPARPYPFGLAGRIIDPAPMWRALLSDLVAGTAPGHAAARFQEGLAEVFCKVACDLMPATGARAVALTGGCLQNGQLHDAMRRRLSGKTVLFHGDVPCNDGGLALGQACIAALLAP